MYCYWQFVLKEIKCCVCSIEPFRVVSLHNLVTDDLNPRLEILSQPQKFLYIIDDVVRAKRMSTESLVRATRCGSIAM